MNLKRRKLHDFKKKNYSNLNKICRIIDNNDNNRKPRACSKKKKDSPETAEDVTGNEVKDEKEKKKKSTEKKVTKRTKKDEQSESEPSTNRKTSRPKTKTDQNTPTENLIESQIKTKTKRQTTTKSGRGRKKAQTVQNDEIMKSPEITVESNVEDLSDIYCPISSSIEIDEPKCEVLQQSSDYYTEGKELDRDSDDSNEFSFEDADKDVEEYLNLLQNFDEEKSEPSPFDQTMYDVFYIPTKDGFIEEDRNWDADFDPKFNIEEHLKKKPNKSCLRRKPPTNVSKKILTYKYLDENNQEKYIINGFSHSTFIKRVITYLKSLTTAFEMEIAQLIVPGINLEARMLGNLQMIGDIFRLEMMPMVIYSIYNKDSNDYYLTLMKQLDETIKYFLSFSYSNIEQYEFPNSTQIFPITDDPNINTEYVYSVDRTDDMKFAENVYLFQVFLIYGVFNKQIHMGVLRNMFDFFIDTIHKVAVSAMSVD